jgi:hypothetical protein
MPLEAALTEFDCDVATLVQHFRKFAATKPALSSPAAFSFVDECLLEGLLSRAWQSWCTFSRRCVVESCLGSTTSAGLAVPGVHGVTTEAEVSGAARAARRNPNPPYWGSAPNTELRLEPTWGDVDVLNSILTRLNPSNATQLLAAFSEGHESAKALQAIRNAAAHNHNQSIAEIRRMSSAFIAFPISHPTHALFWITPTSKDFLITHSLADLCDVGAAAVA